MRYLALACDYDGTLANNGKVRPETLAALRRVVESGRKLVLVTGRLLEDLYHVFPEADLFHWIVAENGAVLYCPATREERQLGMPPPQVFLQALHEANICPCEAGRVIVSTRHPHETAVLDLIRRFGLELQIIFNKGAVMILPSGVNKASGLMVVLETLRLAPHNVAAVGDGENDHALLSAVEAGVAVANAVPLLREEADLVTQGDHGAGVAELIDYLVHDDLTDLDSRLKRHHLLLGYAEDGREIHLPPYGTNLLVTGTSGGGKSTLATGFLEQLASHKYQFCVIDPEGDYEQPPSAVAVGTNQEPPRDDAVLQLLEDPRQNVAVNMISVSWKDRPAYFLKLLGRLQELRAATGRPHWIIVDEAHHVLPAEHQAHSFVLPERLDGMVLITLEPNLVTRSALEKIENVMAVGKRPEKTLRIFSESVGAPDPNLQPVELAPGQTVFWARAAGRQPRLMEAEPPRTERRRHNRKYAEGELPPDRSFYFRGPDEKLSLRAQNLILFLQIADGVDDETWRYHLERGDYSRWFREGIKNEELADEAVKVENRENLSIGESRREIRRLIEKSYTLPSDVSIARPATVA